MRVNKKNFSWWLHFFERCRKCKMSLSSSTKLTNLLETKYLFRCWRDIDQILFICYYTWFTHQVMLDVIFKISKCRSVFTKTKKHTVKTFQNWSLYFVVDTFCLRILKPWIVRGNCIAKKHFSWILSMTLSQTSIL